MAALEEVVAELQDQRLVGCFAHPSVPRLVSVDHLGQVSVTCAHKPASSLAAVAWTFGRMAAPGPP